MQPRAVRLLAALPLQAHLDGSPRIFALAASEAGDWLYNLALVVVVFERTHSTGLAAATSGA